MGPIRGSLDPKEAEPSPFYAIETRHVLSPFITYDTYMANSVHLLSPFNYKIEGSSSARNPVGDGGDDHHREKFRSLAGSHG